MSRKRTDGRKVETGIRWWKGALQAYVRVRGRLHVQTFRVDDYADQAAALEAARDWRKKTTRQHFGGGARADRAAFVEKVAAYGRQIAAKPTAKQVLAHLELWMAALGRDRAPLTVTTAEINEVIQGWLVTPSRPDYQGGGRGRPSGAKGIHKQTIRKRRNSLRTFYAVMFPGATNPVQAAQNFAAGKPEVRGTDYATIARILAAMPDYHSHKTGTAPTRVSLAKLRAAAVAYTAIPPGVLGTVRRQDLQLTAMPPAVRIAVGREKGGGVEVRTLPLTADGAAALAALDAAAGLGPFNADPVNRSFKRAAKRVDAPAHLTVYDLRHSFGAQVYRSTRDEATVARLLLHAEGSTSTARYRKAADAEVDAVAVSAFTASVARLEGAAAPALAAPPAAGSCPAKLSRTAKPRQAKHLRSVG